MTGALAGVLLGALAATGVLLIAAGVPMARRPGLDDRLAPYLRDAPRPSRLLSSADTLTPFPTVERLLRTLSSFLREDARTRSELETRQGWTVNAARLALTAPWALLLLLSTQPDAVAAYNTPAGTVVLLVGGGVSLAAYRLMLRIARLPTERRVLR